VGKKAELVTVHADGTYIYHWALQGKPTDLWNGDVLFSLFEHYLNELRLQRAGGSDISDAGQHTNVKTLHTRSTLYKRVS
jgi:hypothetical protein